jgi:DHA2 family metal-tetracycline-proton antiporter-like MFS transporter
VIGFYNLTLNVATSIGITYTAAMIESVSFKTILSALSLITLLALCVYGLLIGKTKEHA